MPASIGVNLRVTGHCSRGGRKYMEDFFTVAYQQSEDEKDLEYAFIGIYDGHGGAEAARFARKHLINLIVNQKLFWSENDDDILKAIREGYIATHYAMWREQDKWPKTQTGLPSTAGTTASVAFIRHGKIYIGHCGDSGICLGYTEDNDKTWQAMPLTQDHKPESNVEKARIINSGGKVVSKYGVPRVVWNRPRLGHKGPVRRSTPIDEIPFLAVARSLGDLWSYNSALNEFVVSPDPDVRVVKINPEKFRCLVFGTDGLWNVISAETAVKIVHNAEKMNDQRAMNGAANEWTNPSKCLVDKALERWSTTKMRADNTSVVIIMLDPPGPPKRDVLKTCPSQLILENDEMDQQQLTEDKTFAMHDYCTKETVELNNIPSMLSGGINRYETVGYAHASTSSSIDVSYANSFAESYNSLLNANMNNDHAYHTYPTHEPETHSSNSDDTYSLTKLETRMEQIASSSSPSMLFAEYHQHQQRYDERHQYDCITSSFLSPSCEIHPNLEDSVQAVVMDVVETATYPIDAHSYSNEIDASIEMNDDLSEFENQPEASTSYGTEDANLCSQMPSTSSIMHDDCVTNGTTDVTPPIDESIQINEISSSSKENDEKSSSACEEKLTRSKAKHKLNQERRITRSNVLKPNDNGIGKHTNRSAISKTLRTISKKQFNVQNENVINVPPRTLRRANTSAVDTSKRSLRSDDTMDSNKTLSNKVKATTPQRNRNSVQSMATSSVQNIPSETLREKVKPNQQTNAKPKNISKFNGKKVALNARQTTVSKLQRSRRLNR
ncbi:uncharacterized protein LOC119077855 [Bradysia coprophila]|uniref:uncharacterized protein LOC119077855 n=1 Tax=Bradysia coprophila TaxID=38358 RepID=UPI00187DC642|nr:uncharacterized protein LOC119077855 [Bradysia coprophila]